MSPSLTCSRIVANKLLHKCPGSGHFCNTNEKTYRPIVPTFAARISGVFADVEAPGDESGNE